MQAHQTIRYLSRLASLAACLAIFLVGQVPALVRAQGDLSELLPIGGLEDLPTLNGLPLDLTPVGDKVKLSARFTVGEDGRPPMLYITAEIGRRYHIYSTTQPSGGPQPSRIHLEESTDYSLSGPLTALQPPRTHIDKVAWPGLQIEEHYGNVTWAAPVIFSAGVDPRTAVIRGDAELQVCTESSCAAESFPFEARATTEQVGVAGEYRAEGSSVVLRAYLEPTVVRPGGEATLTISATPDPDWHIYARRESDPGAIGEAKPTLIAITAPEGFTAYRPETDARVHERPSPKEGGSNERYHAGPVSWTSLIQVPADAELGEYTLEGLIGYQVCLDTACQPPLGARFSGVLTVGEATQLGPMPLVLTASTYSEVAAAVSTLPLSPASGGFTMAALLVILGSALIGGLILNLMPCVLPVIGLKVLAFVEQGGQNRGRILALNLWYSAGLISVFLALATLAAFFNLGWGQQFTQLWFKVALTGLVFVMALSFLGIWEIPIPGFATTGKATELAAREDAVGAFSKGAFTTVLATPCSAPFLGPVFGFTLEKPPHVIYLIFAAVGLGMALPYLAIGAFPSLIRFLPKPGAWMETFKQAMAFLLLGTVVFLMSAISEAYFIPTLTFLVGLWLGCWWIGRTSPVAPPLQRANAWIVGVGAAALVGMFAFGVLAAEGEDLAWQPYSPGTLVTATAEGKTVMVDFTADWCWNCKANTKFAINTPDVRALVERNGVVALLADWTDESDVIKAALLELHSDSIPLLAIYPAGRPEDVIVLRDLLTEGQVLDALRAAGPSHDLSQGAAPAAGPITMETATPAVMSKQ